MNALATEIEHPTTATKGSTIGWFPVIALGLLWLEVISRLQLEWSINPQYSYGWAVPILAAYIFWRRWNYAPPTGNPSARPLVLAVIVLAALAFAPIRLIQEANPDWRLLSWAMALCAVAASAGAIYLAGGSAWLRHFSFPILFFLVAVPWPTFLEQIVIQGLMRIDALINVEVLTAIGIPAVQLGNVIEVNSGYVGIDEACAGIRSLQATFMVSLFLGEFYGFSVLRRFILVIAGALLAFFCNLVRTFLLVYLGAEHGFQAIHNWHDPAGHTILVICLLGLWGLSLLLSRKDEELMNPPRASAGFRIPRLALILVLVFTVVAEAGTQLWYLSHEARTVKAAPWNIAWPTHAANWKEVAVDEGSRGLLRYNEGGGGNWFADGHNWSMYFFKWLPGRTAGLFIKNHRPDICLPASGMTQRGGGRNKLLTVNGVQLPIRAYVFENAGRPLHVFYCYWDGTPPEAGNRDQEDWTASGRLDAVKRGKRDIGTQMLEIVAWGYDDDAKAEAAAVEQLRQIIKPG
ncbi:MAG TPA: exosortase/archaeosortase family protein [Chthoniobacterales bacterium]|jgi:exosortase|nr:exosortase/archaeosortase family protein [Chthoniobacterales bacterium]